MAGALHDGLGALQFDIGPKSLGRIEIRRANQQKPEFRLAQLLVEFGIATSSNIELRCRAHNAYEASLFFGEASIYY